MWIKSQLVSIGSVSKLLALQLVDELATSDDIILEKMKDKSVIVSEIQSEKATFTKNR